MRNAIASGSIAGLDQMMDTTVPAESGELVFVSSSIPALSRSQTLYNQLYDYPAPVELVDPKTLLGGGDLINGICTTILEERTQLPLPLAFEWQSGELRPDQRAAYEHVKFMCSVNNSVKDEAPQSAKDCEDGWITDGGLSNTTYHTFTLADLVRRVLVEGRAFSPATYKHDQHVAHEFRSSDTLCLKFNNHGAPYFRLADAEQDEFIRRNAFIVYHAPNHGIAEGEFPSDDRFVVGFHLANFVYNGTTYETLHAKLHAMYPAADTSCIGCASMFYGNAEGRYALVTHRHEGPLFPDGWGRDDRPVLNYLRNELLTKSARKGRKSRTESFATASIVRPIAQEKSGSIVTATGSFVPAPTFDPRDLSLDYASTYGARSGYVDLPCSIGSSPSSSPVEGTGNLIVPARNSDMRYCLPAKPVTGKRRHKKATYLRYPGGKSKAIKKMRPYFPATFSEYREPFVGGGSAFIHIRRQFPHVSCWINDIDYTVYCFYKMAKERNAELVDELLRIKKWSGGDVGKRFFTQIPSLMMGGDELKTAIALYYRNKTSFSGLTWQGSFSANAWEHNFSESCIWSLTELEEILDGVLITNFDYRDLLQDSVEDVFTYFDPPYKLGKIFLYGNGGANHRLFDHRQFFENVSTCNHKWFVTYNYNEALRQMYSGFSVDVVPLRYTMRPSIKNSTTGRMSSKEGNELFIRDY